MVLTVTDQDFAEQVLQAPAASDRRFHGFLVSALSRTGPPHCEKLSQTYAGKLRFARMDTDYRPAHADASWRPGACPRWFSSPMADPLVA